MAHLVRERTPWGLLLSASERGRDWGPRLAALGPGTYRRRDRHRVRRRRADGRIKPAFGGNIVAPILSKTFPQMATVRAGVCLNSPPPIAYAKPRWRQCARGWQRH
jgi:electron transfer flavoprotein alpha subunit